MLIAFVVFYLVMGISVTTTFYLSCKGDEDFKIVPGWKLIAGFLIVSVLWPIVVVLMPVACFADKNKDKHL